MTLEQLTLTAPARYLKRALPPLHVGAPIYDRSGRLVGVVAEIFGAIFRVEVPWESNLWLGIDVVDEVREDRSLTLTIDRDEMSDRNIGRAGAA